MSLFGINPRPAWPIPDTEFSGIDFKTVDSLETFIRLKKTISNHTNLRPFIRQYVNWYTKNGDLLDQKTRNKAGKFKNRLQAENVIRFMYMAQKHMDRLNNYLFSKKILTEEKKDRICMKGGAEFGPVIVDFDFYGRIDALGDIVNVASRITDKGSNQALVSGILEQPLLIGPNLKALLPQSGFVNTTKNYMRLKGKDAPVYVYAIHSIESFDNRALIDATAFARYKKQILTRIDELDRVKQKTLPFNYAGYKIEDKDKYLVDHSKRVAMNCLHIIDLINRHCGKNPEAGREPITAEQKQNTVTVALLHDIGKHSLNDQVKAYIDPSKSVRALTKEEKEVFNRLTSSFGCSILESIGELKPFARFVRCSAHHYNGIYHAQSHTADLAGDNIPVESRIVAVANAIDSIVSDTPFREKMNLENLIRILTSDMEKSDSQVTVQKFDPAVVPVVIDYYQQILMKCSGCCGRRIPGFENIERQELPTLPPLKRPDPDGP